mmetsp:Transcript_96467/g.229712  ORF Transcript_96467/g.229712 Transcript_96467/m.229712 type:complete len:236 (-) Transcript_96467:966-1673(-)
MDRCLCRRSTTRSSSLWGRSPKHWPARKACPFRATSRSSRLPRLSRTRDSLPRTQRSSFSQGSFLLPPRSLTSTHAILSRLYPSAEVVREVRESFLNSLGSTMWGLLTGTTWTHWWRFSRTFAKTTKMAPCRSLCSSTSRRKRAMVMSQPRRPATSCMRFSRSSTCQKVPVISLRRRSLRRSRRFSGMLWCGRASATTRSWRLQPRCPAGRASVSSRRGLAQSEPSMWASPSSMR